MSSVLLIPLRFVNPSRYQVIADLNPLYLANGVDIVFNGHDHDYERIENDNVVYLEIRR